MEDRTLEQVEEALKSNREVGTALLELGMATSYNGDAFRKRGFEALAVACDALCAAVAEAIIQQADEFIALTKQCGAMEAQIADLESLLDGDV